MRRLRSRLLELEVDRVDLVPSGPPPLGAKGDPVTLAKLQCHERPMGEKTETDGAIVQYREASV